MKLINRALTTTTLALAACSSVEAAFEMNIVGVLPPTVGTVEPGGTVVTPVNGAQAQFELSLLDTDTMATSTGYLQVTLDSFTSDLTKHSITTGQGHSDRVGILIEGGSNRSATYTFSFYQDSDFLVPLELDFVMQVADIDSSEQFSVSDAAFSGYTLSSGTQLVELYPVAPGFIGLTNSAGENPDKANPQAAANFQSIANVSSFQVIVAGSATGYGSEFQFDFTPDIVVPEPSTYACLLGIVAFSTVALRRRRF
ncbi:PEP-CTERM sorting domain-containing protein [Coraliomargarita algicola]|uniref:PEP-CTERM sorting domain-containing protein n=1 Tax=Coraliomargarita algicola TaxID=3092156 RepID=A0ABZ0RL49_9BACT|nr:PEP-CTERM sorting domain-containing protein [Coraliomargarita sp. J2-16]WPJ95740.1 PEP-CTERM sorting domain-containing protein [Coraliomargarita sp. J2-16]